MYRRNISNILYPIAGVIGLFIVYEALLKPAYVPAPTSLESQSETSGAVETAPEAAMEEPQDTAPKQLRVIDAGGVPETKYHEALEAIREEIEKGNLKDAESRLNGLAAAIRTDDKSRPYVAILWNNLGIEREKLEGTKGSLKAFKKAASLDDKNPVIHMNLAHAYWEQRDPSMTQDFLERLIALAPQEAFPHLALADMLQERGHLSEAARHLDQAVERAGGDSSMRSYLQTVVSKLRRTEQTEARMTTREGAHFVVKYDGEADHDTWAVVLDNLEEAYREIGQKFGHFPSRPIVVVLHAKGTFQNETGSPAWADGLFDPVLGRIQVPMQGALTDRAWLKRVLRHEFVHALLHDQQGLNTSALPAWLNEGLAMQLSSDQWPEVEALLRQELHLIPLTTLEGGWGGLSAEAASMAYVEANSAARYLIHRYGMHEVQQLLGRLKRKQPLAAAMQSQLSLSYEQFQSRWMEQLREERKKA